eukprot:CAMPEP_0118679888 /NCGR_PEP_ID=MMETSP0800-20121206/4039_1 /TAXON_ID=210618 ORGANISM="Striatella unipunctata, Strain CCMP2910" /NCGR_SAMPLE_ID=MMETSP0800 /ASSEMBLY_ACC=CAM_ASM_000638 /LENGTH=381 /DNA_ID=CAMNT_0006575935 /DNA_START=140 /DNA_END=1285 /DNA_ORIENTATION=+
MKEQLTNRKAILTGIFLQFVILPSLGFVVVNALNMNHAMGITLLVVTSSPGGSYSNWWCSMFNADLALSVTMTAISTLLSTIMLPLNLLIYARYSYEQDVISSLDWGSLFKALIIVITAIVLGLYGSYRIHSHNFNVHANRLGNFAGIALVVFSAVLSSSDEDSQMWERPWKFYFGVAAPCVFGLIIANLITTGLTLRKPERVTVSIECCYQNVGIATSVAMTMFDGDELAEAMGVPFFYGTVEAAVLGLYCVAAWKAGWTKAPSDASFCKMLSTSYEILQAEKEEKDAVEVFIGHNDGTEHYNTIHQQSSRSLGAAGDVDSSFHYVRHESRQTPREESVMRMFEEPVLRFVDEPARRLGGLLVRQTGDPKEPSYLEVELA